MPTLRALLLACCCLLPSYGKEVEQHLRINNGAEPQTLDPQVMTGVPEATLAMALFEGLTNLHPKTLEPIPGLAERWDISDDRRTYTFHLRAGLTWSDDTLFVAEDLVRSWRRALTSATGSQYQNMFFPIIGAEAFAAAKPQDDDAWAAVGVRALDRRTLEVRLANPCPYFLSLAAFHTLYPVPLAAISAHGDRWTRAEHIVSNGPFVLKQWSPRERIVLAPNDRYWDRGNVTLKQVTILPYDDLETAYKLFKKKEIDWVSSVPVERIDELRHDPEYYVSPYLGLYYLRLNVTRGPLKDPRVRRALAMAVDRRVITDHILKAGQIPATWFCPEGAGGYHADAKQAYDGAAAARLLAEAGFPGGQGFPPLEILFNTSEQHKKICENVAEQWKRVLGVAVVARNCEWKVYLDRLTALDYDVGRSGWIADYSDPNTFFDIWRTDDGNNRTGWGTPAYDRLLVQAAAESDPAKRLALFQAMDRILVDEVPAIPIYIYVNQGLLSERVCGWHPNVRDLHPLQHVWLE